MVANMVPRGGGCNILVAPRKRRPPVDGRREVAAQQVLQPQLPPVHLQSTQRQSLQGHEAVVGFAASSAGESLRSVDMFMGLLSMVAAECRDPHTGACPRGKVNGAFFRAIAA
jgi:hypothetical protein